MQTKSISNINQNYIAYIYSFAPKRETSIEYSLSEKYNYSKQITEDNQLVIKISRKPFMNVPTQYFNKLIDRVSVVVSNRDLANVHVTGNENRPEDELDLTLWNIFTGMQYNMLGNESYDDDFHIIVMENHKVYFIGNFDTSDINIKFVSDDETIDTSVFGLIHYDWVSMTKQKEINIAQYAIEWAVDDEANSRVMPRDMSGPNPNVTVEQVSDVETRETNIKFVHDLKKFCDKYELLEAVAINCRINSINTLIFDPTLVSCEVLIGRFRYFMQDFIELILKFDIQHLILSLSDIEALSNIPACFISYVTRLNDYSNHFKTLDIKSIDEFDFIVAETSLIYKLPNKTDNNLPILVNSHLNKLTSAFNKMIDDGYKPAQPQTMYRIASLFAQQAGMFCQLSLNAAYKAYGISGTFEDVYAKLIDPEFIS